MTLIGSPTLFDKEPFLLGDNWKWQAYIDRIKGTKSN